MMIPGRTLLLLSAAVLLGNQMAGQAGAPTAGEAPPGERTTPSKISRVDLPLSSTCEDLTVRTRIDRGRLAERGEAAMRFVVRGTSEPVRLHLVNETPGVIALEGGDVQLAVTTGGSDNRLERTLATHRAGRFQVRWELAESGCGVSG